MIRFACRCALEVAVLGAWFLALGIWVDFLVRG